MTVYLYLKLSIDTKLYELFNVLLHHGSYKSKRLTENTVLFDYKYIIKLSAAIHLNFENKSLLT